MVGADFNSLEDYISALTTKDPNKLAVYAGYKKYDLEINGITHHILENTMLEFDGKLMNGEQLYELLQNSKP